MVEVTPRVRQALAAGHPVVALESTLISHGLPSPHNIACALDAERAVREAGAEPATIGIIGGRMKVGLSVDDIEMLADPASQPHKVSTRDLAVTVAQKRDGATTVAATMWIAARAGIRVFATGGIGGIHRGVANTFDISADLRALATTPVAVVCAGAKLILDLPKTVEALEALGVPTLGLKCHEFPGFYVRETGLILDATVSSEADAAAVLHTHFQLNLDTGLLVLNPVPAAVAIDANEASIWIDEALSAAQAQHIVGKAVTPFLLEKVAALSDGRALSANIALIQNNARAAASIAIALQALAPG